MVRGLGNHGQVLINPLYEDEERGEGEAEEREMSAVNADWSFPPPSPTHSSNL